MVVNELLMYEVQTNFVMTDEWLVDVKMIVVDMKLGVEIDSWMLEKNVSQAELRQILSLQAMGVMQVVN